MHRTMPEALFIYGTLHPDRAPAEMADVVSKLRPLGPGTIRGRLYDLGEYPGVIVGAQPGEKVTGEVFALPDDPEVLVCLDRYEGFVPSDPANSLFVRSKQTVTFADGRRRRCWVYLYNGELLKGQ